MRGQIFVGGEGEIAEPAKQVPDTLLLAQLKSRPEMRVDALVIGAGPTGLACGIEAQRAASRSWWLTKGAWSIRSSTIRRL